MTGRALPPDPAPVDVLAAGDPVAAVLAAHQAGRRLLLRTSGTTGTARGVVRTTESWFASFRPVSELLGLSAASRVWVPGPLHATMNLFAAVHAAHLGAAVVDEAGSATHAVLTPATLDRVLDDLPAGLHLVVAGDQLSRGLHDRAVHAGQRVSHYYGAAELSFVAWGAHAPDLRPFPGVELEVDDGVLWARSPYLAEDVSRADGFATVGDRGELTEGRVVVHGRDELAITTAGATVRVADVERVLRATASGELYVVPLPHAGVGAAVAAVLTDPADHSGLVDAARARLDAASRPRVWFHIAEVPLAENDKPDRTALAEAAASGALTRLVLR